VTATRATVHLCFGWPTECQNCGGHTKAVHPDEGRGPFPGDDRFCSEECYVEFQEVTDRIAAMPSRATACRSCGLDNFEHTEECDAEGPPKSNQNGSDRPDGGS
jgi:hypothetical protein